MKSVGGDSKIVKIIIAVLLVVSLPLAIKLVQQSQENRSNAASNAIVQDSKCKNAGGVCQKTSTKCDGTWKSGYCPSGGSNVKCCISKTGGSSDGAGGGRDTITQDSKCKNAGGVCQKTSTKCDGTWKSGYCPSGGSNVKCCISKTGGGRDTITQDSKCKNIGGTCQKVSASCTGSKEYKSGYCPSNSSDVKCCAPKSSVPTSTSE